MLTIRNLYRNISLPKGDEEVFEELVKKQGVRIERIVSNGQVTPPGKWYDQPKDEFVALLKGKASIEFQEGKMVHLTEGDYLMIPSGLKHRVAYTSKNPHCVWVAIHIDPQ
jgi:cupin 2 domain-containing protein